MPENYPLWSPRRRWPTFLLLHWILLIDFVHLDTVKRNTQSFHGLIDRTLKICICIAVKDDGVPVDSQLQLVFSGVTKTFFHSISFLLYFPAQENIFCSFAYGQEHLYSQAMIHPHSNQKVPFVLWTQHDFLLLFFKVIVFLLLWTDCGMTLLGKAQDLYWQMLPVP